jgi:hypothetical protein
MAWPIMQKGCYGGRAGKSIKAVEGVMVQFEKFPRIVILERGIIARGICCFRRWQQADSSPMNPASE